MEEMYIIVEQFINQPVFGNSSTTDYTVQYALEVQLVRFGLYLFAAHPFPGLV